MARKKTITEKQKRGTYEAHKQKRVRRTASRHFPAPLQELGDAEQVIYDRLCNHLHEADALMDADAFILTAAAVNLAQMQKIIPALREQGAIQHFENGTRNVSPEYSIFEKCNTLFLRHSKVLGLDPRSRQDMLIFLEQGEADSDNALINELLGRN